MTLSDPGPGDVSALADRIRRLRTNWSGGHRTVQQPVTLLWAIGRARRREARMTPWPDTDQAITGLLRTYATHGERPRADFPVAALYHAGLWDLPGFVDNVPRAHRDKELEDFFGVNSPEGGLPDYIHKLMQQSSVARAEIVSVILHEFFPDVDSGPLMHDVGLDEDELAADLDEASLTEQLPEEYGTLCSLVELRESAHDRGSRVLRTRNDPVRYNAARRAVLLRSNGMCENPRCTGQPTDLTDHGDPILEADHIHEIAAGGRDHPEQMIALCPNCHAVKTRGSTRKELVPILVATAQHRHEARSHPTLSRLQMPD